MTSYASSFLDVQNAVMDKLRLDDDGTPPSPDRARVKDYINQVYTQVAVETRCLATAGTATMSDEDGSYAMPAGILHIESLTLTDGIGQVYPPLVQCRLDKILRARRFNSAVGPPRLYSLVGMNQLEFWPAARSTDVLTFWYSYLPDELVEDGDVSELPEPFGSKLLEYGALVQAAEFAKDPLLGEFTASYGFGAGPDGKHSGWFAAFQRFVNRRAGQYPMAFDIMPGGDFYGFPDRSSDWNLSWGSGVGWPS